MTTLENSYCRPKTEEEWEMIYPNASWLGLYPSKESHVYFDGTGKYLASGPNENTNRNEIPVQHFLDLLNDSIVPWRLEELNFNPTSNYNTVSGKKQWMYWKEDLIITPEYASAGGGSRLYPSTFTDLLTLIRFLSPT